MPIKTLWMYEKMGKAIAHPTKLSEQESGVFHFHATFDHRYLQDSEDRIALDDAGLDNIDPIVNLQAKR